MIAIYFVIGTVVFVVINVLFMMYKVEQEMKKHKDEPGHEEKVKKVRLISFGMLAVIILMGAVTIMLTA